MKTFWVILAVIILAAAGYLISVNRAPAPHDINDGGNGTGMVSGYVHVGPVCPVERMPPDPNCADRPYAVTIEIHFLDERLVGTVSSGADGIFTTSLPAGTYLLRPQLANVLPACNEERVTVIAGQTSSVDISCDSGIR